MANPWETMGNMPTPQDDFSDLDGFGAEAKAEHAFKTKVDSLPDGTYEVTVASAGMEMVGGHRVLRVGLKLADGAQVEWISWLNKQQGVNGLLADFSALGFDSHQWGPKFNRPLSIEIARAVARLPGMKLRGLKSSRKGQNGETYHEFRVLGRISTTPMPTGPIQSPAALPGTPPGTTAGRGGYPPAGTVQPHQQPVNSASMGNTNSPPDDSSIPF